MNGMGLTFTDGIGGDNGFLFLWALTFSEDFTPEPISFEATVGAGCDSSFWAPDGAYGIPEVDVLGNCNSLSIAPPDAGTYDYTYIATDAFGCMADTTLTVTVVEGPEFLVTATATDACNAALPVVLSATPIGAVSPSPFANYTWQAGGTTIGATNPAFDFAPVIGANNYSLIFTDQAVAPATGNCVFTWDGTVTLSEAPTASMLPPVGCTTTGLALESNSTSPTGAALTHTWSIVDAGGTEVATGSGQAVTINGLPAGDYSVVLTVSDGSCSATVTRQPRSIRLGGVVQFVAHLPQRRRPGHPWRALWSWRGCGVGFQWDHGRNRTGDRVARGVHQSWYGHGGIDPVRGLRWGDLPIRPRCPDGGDLQLAVAPMGCPHGALRGEHPRHQQCGVVLARHLHGGLGSHAGRRFAGHRGGRGVHLAGRIGRQHLRAVLNITVSTAARMTSLPPWKSWRPLPGPSPCLRLARGAHRRMFTAPPEPPRRGLGMGPN